MVRRGLVSCVLVLCLVGISATAKGETQMISEGKKVRIDYTLTVDGAVVDSSKANGPLEYMHGEGTIIRGLERQMEGLQVGDTKSIVVTAAEGYGEINPQAFREVPKTQLPAELKPEAGQLLSMRLPDGKTFPVVISEVRNDTVMLDLNHPLAGKELFFDITVVSIE